MVTCIVGRTALPYAACTTVAGSTITSPGVCITAECTCIPAVTDPAKSTGPALANAGSVATKSTSAAHANGRGGPDRICDIAARLPERFSGDDDKQGTQQGIHIVRALDFSSRRCFFTSLSNLSTAACPLFTSTAW